MNFDQLFKRAWHIIWNNKILWLFGFLASCTSGFGRGGANFNFPGGGGGGADFDGDFSGLPSNGQLPPFFSDMGRQMEQFFSSAEGLTIALVVIGLVLLGILFAILTFVVGNYGRVALIKGIQTAELDDAKLTFSQLHQMGLAQLKDALLLNFLVGLALFLIFGAFALVGVLFAAVTLGIGLLCLVPLICLLVPVSWGIGLVVLQANIALVTENLGWQDALRRGWQVVRAKPGVIIGMYFVTLFGAGIIGVIISLPYLVAIVPGVIGFIADPGMTGGAGVGIAITIAAICLYTPVLIVLSSVLLTFVHALLTLVYMDVVSELPAPGEAPDFLPANTK